MNPPGAVQAHCIGASTVGSGADPVENFETHVPKEYSSSEGKGEESKEKGEDPWDQVPDVTLEQLEADPKGSVEVVDELPKEYSSSERQGEESKEKREDPSEQVLDPGLVDVTLQQLEDMDMSVLQMARAGAAVSLLMQVITAPIEFIGKMLSNRSLHRGVPMQTLVRDLGIIFTQGSKGIVYRGAKASQGLNEEQFKESWYAQSEALPGDQPLKGFVSHDWKAPGWRKGMALSLHFNNTRAIILLSVIMMVVICPVAFVLRGAENPFLSAGVVIAIFLGLALMYVVLVYQSHRKELSFMQWNRTEDRFFLDICVISQTKKELMKQGIEHLTEYLLVSKQLIVLWTPRYTTRVWCVCEIATYFRRMLALERADSKDMNTVPGELIMLPLWLPPYAQIISALTLLLSLSGLVIAIQGEATPALLILCGVSGSLAFLVTVGVSVAYFRTMYHMVKLFRTFESEKAECFDEGDKRLVLAYIQDTWQSAPGAADGIAEFEGFVRNHLANNIAKRFITLRGLIKCLFQNSILVMFWEVLLVCQLMVGFPFLLFTLVLDSIVSDKTQKDNVSEVVPLWTRLQPRRIFIWALMLLMAVFSCMHCYSCLVWPIPLDYQYVYGEQLRQEVEQPSQIEFVWEGASGSSRVRLQVEAIFASTVFGILAITFLITIVLLIFQRKKAPRKTQPVPRPEGSNTTLRQWVEYFRDATAPGNEFFWHRLLSIEFVEFVLQFIRWAQYGGWDMIENRSVPAADDRLVILQTIVLCLDLVLIGLCAHRNNVGNVIVVEALLDISYATVPLIALGNIDHKAWYRLRSAKGLDLLDLFTSLLPMVKSLQSLKTIDGMFFRLHAKKSRSSTRSSLSSDPNVVRDWAGYVKSTSNVSALVLSVVRSRLQTAARFCAAAALALTVIMVQIRVPEDCQQMRESQGPFREWTCHWETHPVMKQPHCDCRFLVWNKPGENRETCGFHNNTLTSVFEVVQTLEYVKFGVPLDEQCRVTNDVLTGLPVGSFRHLLAFEAGFQHGIDAIPEKLREAKDLKFISISFAYRIAHMPSWVEEFEDLQTLHVTHTSLEVIPDVVFNMPQLFRAKFDYNPACDDRAAVADATARLSEKDIDFSCRTHEGGEVQALANCTDYHEELTAIFQSACKIWEDGGNSRVCESDCTLWLAMSPTVDPEARGALTNEESAPILRMVNIDPPNSTEQFECTLLMSDCQDMSLLPRRERVEAAKYVWYTTMAKVFTSGKTDCGDCFIEDTTLVQSYELQRSA
eukprot:gnl/MRDRNA2_/MRDRNA2_81013_c0_seq1.p1 gnl/MRDRNA2_/MRDRNA2_81013_c0~~gnl/MRDRNA2_/MRDRNA2_81013_c0_seq1.p1  ORF type:complete len:1259 (+),score=161.78 gnl/MRDRNA2_/MRDRNA2_81013_c0_seq1:57-3833(+)